MTAGTHKVHAGAQVRPVPATIGRRPRRAAACRRGARGRRVRLSEICIERPVLATVISLLITLLGAIALLRLPNRELPDVDPPIVSVTTVYPGAAPEVVETSVTEPLEDS